MSVYTQPFEGGRNVILDDNNVAISAQCCCNGTGACCSSGTCHNNISETDCTNGGGHYLGNSSTCAGPPVVNCAQGACCVGQICHIATQAGCPGAYRGDGSTCDPPPCGPYAYGSCCCSDCSCYTTIAAGCTGSCTFTPNGNCATDCAQSFNTGCSRSNYVNFSSFGGTGCNGNFSESYQGGGCGPYTFAYCFGLDSSSSCFQTSPLTPCSESVSGYYTNPPDCSVGAIHHGGPCPCISSGCPPAFFTCPECDAHGEPPGCCHTHCEYFRGGYDCSVTGGSGDSSVNLTFGETSSCVPP